MFLDRFDVNLHVVKTNLPEHLHQPGTFLGIDAIGPPLDHLAVGLQGAEIAAGRNVTGLQVEVDAEGVQLLHVIQDVYLSRALTVA